MIGQGPDEARDKGSRRIETANLKRLINETGDGLVIVDHDGSVLFANPAAITLVGAERLRERLDLPTDSKFHEWTLPDGRTIEVHLTEFKFQGRAARIASLRDITTRKLAEQELRAVAECLEQANVALEEVATRDPLTELLNRRGLAEALEVELHRARRTSLPLSTVLVDCDDFKQVNMKLGHAGGDYVLQEVARRLHGALRRTDVLARVGGDEFLLLLPETRIAEGAFVCEKLRLAVGSAPIPYGDRELSVQVSLGLANVRQDTCSIEELLTDTEEAIKRSKALGKNTVTVAGPVELAASLQKYPTIDEVRDLLRRGQSFRHCAQALHDLRDGTVVAYELFSRGPQGAFEMPDDFFRLAREAAMLTLVDLACLKSTLRATQRLPAAAKLHVNVFPSTVMESFSDRLLRLLQADTDPRRICIELSENHFVGDPGRLRTGLKQLRGEGVRLAIDDVGFGRTSLETLILLEPDFVKIDRSYISGAGSDGARKRQVQRLVNVVETLGATCIAEGIETPEDLSFLREIGVRIGQGFHWGKLQML